MKLLLLVLILMLLVCLDPGFEGQEAMASMVLPPASCRFAQELGYAHWGWNAMCLHDLAMMAAFEMSGLR